MTVWTLVRDACFFMAFASGTYCLVAIIAADIFFARGRRRVAASAGQPDFTPPISILKPIRGLDREAYENYASFCRQDYPEFEILFCVTDESDPAVPVIEQIIRDFPECSIRLLVGSEPLGVSDKVNKLCRMVREARHEIVIVNDSDVHVGPGFLRAVAAPFRDPEVGGVTCLYRGLTDGSFAANLEALGNSCDFAPGVLIAWLFGGKKLNFMLGAVMATTKTHLAEIGGFEALADYFCDDYELGNRLAAKGHRVELSAFPVDIVYPSETLGEAFRHQLRWNLSIRYSRPSGHFGLIFTHNFIWSFVALLAAQTWPWMFAFVGMYLLLRLEMALSVGARGMKDRLARSHIGILWMRDLFAFCVWVASFFPQRILWRGREFFVREKRLVPAPARHS
jgi:ceramide glucosyltransferase